MANDKNMKIIVFIGIAMILLILLTDILAPPDSSGGKKAQTTAASEDSYTAKLESRVKDIIFSIDCAADSSDEITVMITLENLEENVYANGNSVAMVRTPRVRGAAVVCPGGRSAVIREKIVATVSKALGISSARISVTE